MDHSDAPGCALAVIQGGEVVYEHGYGMANLEHGVPIWPGTVFHSGSISKQFTAYVVVSLAHEGRLSLDDDVRRYVPEMPDYGTPITLRQLLQHTSGVRDQWALLRLSGKKPDDVITEREVLDIITRQKALNFTPGTEQLYSNSGFTLLAIVAARVTGKSLRTLAEERIFRPLGMTRSHFHDDHTQIVPGRAQGYARKKSGGHRISVPAFDTVGPSSLFTTVQDLARWDHAFDRDDPVLRDMMDPARLNDGSRARLAMGLAVGGKIHGADVIEHGGADAGYQAYFLRVPQKKLSVALLCDFAEANPHEYAVKVANVYLGGESTSPAPPPAPVDAGDPARWPGVYWNRARDEVMRVILLDHKLFAGAGNGVELRPTGADRYMVRGMGLHFRAGHPVTVERVIQGERDLFYERQEPDLAVDLGQIAGVYRSEELGAACTLVAGKAQIVWRQGYLDDRTFVPFMPDGFLSEDGFVLHIQRGPDGQPAGLTLTTARARRISFTKL